MNIWRTPSKRSRRTCARALGTLKVSSESELARHGRRVTRPALRANGRGTCASGSCGADPSVEVVHLAEAENMLRQLREQYVSAVERACPWLTDVPVFKRWLSGESPAM